MKKYVTELRNSTMIAPENISTRIKAWRYDVLAFYIEESLKKYRSHSEWYLIAVM